MTVQELYELLIDFIGDITDNGIEDMEVYRLAAYIVSRLDG